MRLNAAPVVREVRLVERDVAPPRVRDAAVVRFVNPGADIVVSVESSLMMLLPALRIISPVVLPPRVRV